jgi:hypothetical protein
MPEIFNPTQFPLFIHELGKQLAPFETAVVADADLAAKFIAPGVLKDAAELGDAIGRRAEDSGLDAEDIKAEIEHEIAIFHDEHSAPTDHVIEHHDQPLEDIHHDAVVVHNVTPAEKAQAAAGHGPVIPANAKLIDGDPTNRTGAAVRDDNDAPEIAPPAGIIEPGDTSMFVEGGDLTGEREPDDGVVA